MMHRIGRFLMAFPVVAVGCVVTPFPFDITATDSGGDTQDAAVEVDSVINDGQPSLKMIIPSPGEPTVVPGPFDFVFEYSDPMDQPAVVTMSGAGIVPVELELDGPGEYQITFVPVESFQGAQTVRMDLVTGDSRQAGVDVDIEIDTLPPVIEFLEPTPAPGQIASNPMPLKLKISDSGTGVRSVVVRVGDFVWRHETQDRGLAEFDTASGGPHPEVPTGGWPSGMYTIEVTAGDWVDGRDSTAARSVSVRRSIEFAADGAGVPAATEEGIGGCGIRIGPAAANVKGIATASGVFALIDGNVRTFSEGFDCDGVLWAVADVNSDGTDDLAGYCRDPDAQKIVFLVQDEGGQFTQMTVLEGSRKLRDLAVGDLNGDGFADLAFLQDEVTALPLVRVVLSQVELDGTLAGWGPVVGYVGAQDPAALEIGRFSENGRNAVLVSSRLQGQFTVFSVDSGGSLLMGINTYYGELAFSALASGSLCAGTEARDTVAAASNCPCSPTVYVGRLDEVSGRIGLIEGRIAGARPIDVDIGDVDGNGVGDVVVLCQDANIVVFLPGGEDCRDFGFAGDGRALASGGARRIWLSDWDNDGLMDIFALTPDGVTVTYFRADSGQGHFVGSYAARFEAVPVDVVAGRFLRPAAGGAAGFLTAAVLSEQTIQVLAPDVAIGMPVDLAALEEDVGPSRAYTGRIPDAGGIPLSPMRGTGLVTGRFGPFPESDGVASDVPLDGLLVATTRTVTELTPESAALFPFVPFAVDFGLFRNNPIKAGNVPRLVVAGDFDMGIDPVVTDAAFVWHRDKTVDVEPAFFLRPLLGDGLGGLVDFTAEGLQIPDLYIQENRQPGAITAFPLRRTVGELLAGSYVPTDILVANKGTSDFTVFLGQGDGRFLAKYDGSLDFAVGQPPVDLAAGYLEGPVDGSGNQPEDDDELPDVVTLTRDGNSSVLVVSYALDRAELQRRGLDVGFEVPLSIIIYQPGLSTPLDPYPQPVALEIADLNNDGLVDIMVLDQARSSVLVFENRGKRDFAEPVEFFTGTRPVAIRAADVNADGCIDILTADSGGKTMTILKNRLCDHVPPLPFSEIR